MGEVDNKISLCFLRGLCIFQLDYLAIVIGFMNAAYY